MTAIALANRWRTSSSCAALPISGVGLAAASRAAMALSMRRLAMRARIDCTTRLPSHRTSSTTNSRMRAVGLSKGCQSANASSGPANQTSSATQITPSVIATQGLRKNPKKRFIRQPIHKG